MKRFFLKKKKGSALQTALFIAVIVLLLLTSFITLTYTHIYFAKITERKTELTDRVAEGMRYAQYRSIPYNEPTVMYSEEESSKELVLTKNHWGVFDVIQSYATIQKDSKKRTALFGGTSNSSDRKAIYLTDRNAPLVLVGSTKIKGNVALPERGVKPGSIKGKYYQGEKLIEGTISRSKPELPQIASEKVNYLKELFKYVPDVSEEGRLDNSQHLERSFGASTQWLYKRGIVDLKDVSIRGNVVVKSDTLVRIRRNSDLQNIIVIAPYIDVDVGFSGTIQVLASQKITVQPKANLSYPSSLIFLQSDEEKKNDYPLISLKERTKFEGVLIALGRDGFISLDDYVEIKNQSSVIGEVYSEFPVFHKGTVSGSIYTNAFLDKAQGSTYINHLYDGDVMSVLPDKFAGLPIKNQSLSLAKWVD